MTKGPTERRKPSRKEILIALAIGGAIGATVFAIQHWPRHTDGASPAHEGSGDPTAAPKTVDRQSIFEPTAPNDSARRTATSRGDFPTHERVGYQSRFNSASHSVPPPMLLKCTVTSPSELTWIGLAPQRYAERAAVARAPS